MAQVGVRPGRYYGGYTGYRYARYPDRGGRYWNDRYAGWNGRYYGDRYYGGGFGLAALPFEILGGVTNAAFGYDNACWRQVETPYGWQWADICRYEGPAAYGYGPGYYAPVTYDVGPY
jgi:hypothetical protein